MDETRHSAIPASDEERLYRLLDDLAASGFHITPEQRIRVTSLFLALRVSGTMPHEHRRLGNMLGPVLCRSTEEQRIFHHIFRYWFPEELSSSDIESRLEDDNLADIWQQIAKERRSFQEEARRRLRQAQMQAWRRHLRIFAPTMLVIFVLAVLLYVQLGQFLPQPSRPQRADGARAVEDTQPGKLPKHVPSQPGVSSNLRNRWENWLGNIAHWLVAVEHTLGPATTLLLMIPLVLLALLIGSSRKLVSAYARQTQIVARNEFRVLLSQGNQEFEVVNDYFYRDVQPMRRQVEGPSDELDIDGTIEATMRAGGYFSPIYTKRRASPEYVVLIDRRHDNDHLACYSRTLVAALERAGVQLMIYYFDHDPRRVTLGPGQRMLALDDLAMLQHSHRLIVLSDGSGLCDMATGHLYPWAVRLAEWPRVVLLTPKDPADWGPLEWLIESELGIAVLPATEEGLLLAAHLFGLENPAVTAMPHHPQALMPDVNRLYGFFAVGVWRWVDDIEPRADAVDALMERLRSGLTEVAFDWLRALAVYPAIYWSLTLFLGSKLICAHGKTLYTAGYMLEIARLPWLEHGRMPDWLRKHLILEMPSDLRDRVRNVLQSLLLTVVSRNPKNLTITMHLPAGEETHRTAQSLNQDEYRQDAILIEFMTRHEASPTDFRFQSKVARALGLPHVRSELQTLFGRSEREMMRRAAEELAQFVAEKPPVALQTRYMDPDIFGLYVRQVTDYMTNAGEHARLARPLYLLKRNPNQPFALMLDHDAMSVWVQRKRLAFYFSLGSVVGLTAILWIVYAAFFETMAGGQAVLIAAIIYVPFLLFRFLLVWPYSKLLKRFPLVTEVDTHFGSE
jgi:hypothetical protein